MTKKIIFLVLMFIYVYTTTLNIFMNEYFRVPAPIILLCPLFIFYKDEWKSFAFWKELIVFLIASFLFYLVGQSVINSFFAFLITALGCALFFNYIIGNNINRLKFAIYIFYGVIFLSSIVMLLDHRIDMVPLRTILIGDTILQKPSGIATTIFAYGYQLAALAPFVFAAVILFKNNIIIRIIAAALCLIFIFYGMQRSVLISFLASIGLLILFYYKARSILIIASIACVVFVAQGAKDKFVGKNEQNILSKNEGAKGSENRSDLFLENVKILKDYPFGLLFYDKTWNDVARHNAVYKSGTSVMSSHNAYLMFITYVGIPLGIILLLLMYLKVLKIVYHSLRNSRNRSTSLIVCLSCSFLCITINACFHNEWLLGASGPTLFLYFAIMQLSKINEETAELEIISVKS